VTLEKSPDVKPVVNGGLGTVCGTHQYQAVQPEDSRYRKSGGPPEDGAKPGSGERLSRFLEDGIPSGLENKIGQVNEFRGGFYGESKGGKGEGVWPVADRCWGAVGLSGWATL